jgi:large subunit ribosomal protein L29
MKENADRARSLDPAELAKQLRDTAEQMFRLRFQISMGQTDGLKKYRSLKKERARMLTVVGERAAGKVIAPAHTETKPAAKPARKSAKSGTAEAPAVKAPKAKSAAAKPDAGKAVAGRGGAARTTAAKTGAGKTVARKAGTTNVKKG